MTGVSVPSTRLANFGPNVAIANRIVHNTTQKTTSAYEKTRHTTDSSVQFLNNINISKNGKNPCDHKFGKTHNAMIME